MGRLHYLLSCNNMHDPPFSRLTRFFFPNAITDLGFIHVIQCHNNASGTFEAMAIKPSNYLEYQSNFCIIHNQMGIDMHAD